MEKKHRPARPLPLLLAAALVACAAVAPASAQSAGAAERGRVARGSLAEVTGRRRVALLVSKALVVDAREPALVALEDYRRALAGEPPPQHAAGARLIADRLNKYIRRYRMMSAAEDYAEADLVIVFKVTAQRPSAIPRQPFVWGKMYVLALAGRDGAARVVWESKGDATPPEEAADDFLKAFKAARGEK
jgi:hypothetical protein